MPLKGEIKMKKYFVGTKGSVLVKMNDMMTVDDLYNDSRLIINREGWIFTEEEHVKDVKHNYEIDEAQNIFDWMEDWDFINAIEVEYESFAIVSEVNRIFAESIDSMSKKELESCNIMDVYTEAAKSNIVGRMDSELYRLNLEWFGIRPGQKGGQ